MGLYLRILLRSILTIAFLFITLLTNAQTLGGTTVFNFLRLPNTPKLTALGGMNVSDVSNDVGLAFNNPALLRPEMHTQLNAVFNGLYDGSRSYHLSLGYHAAPINTSFSWGLNYLDYGSIDQTDASGNILGVFRPIDWVMQISASRSYLEKWNYGMTVKFINSNYGVYRSNGIAVDVGVLYRDTSRAISLSVLAKNMGSQLRRYAGTDAGDLPFDLQAGITKRFEQSPFGFSFTAHHLHMFDITYNDIAFNDANGYTSASDKKFTLDRLFRHFVLAGNIYIGENLQVDAGYNYLRRKELNIGGSGNGLTGFSLGVSLLLGKLQVKYARSHYQNNTAYNQFGLNMSLNQYFGLGRLGKKINW